MCGWAIDVGQIPKKSLFLFTLAGRNYLFAASAYKSTGPSLVVKLMSVDVLRVGC
jgi:hypothetical protein